MAQKHPKITKKARHDGVVTLDKTQYYCFFHNIIRGGRFGIHRHYGLFKIWLGIFICSYMTLLDQDGLYTQY